MPAAPVIVFTAVLVFASLSARAATAPIREVFAQKNIDWPACADCRIDGEGWQTSRSGELLSWEREGAQVRMQLIPADTPASARAYVKMQGVILQSSYRTIPSPYTAMISRKVECSNHYRPKLRGAGEGRYIFTAANHRRAFGVCDEDEADFFVGIRYYYDQDRRRLVKVEYFVPRENQAGELSRLDRRMGEVSAALKKFRNVTAADGKAGA